MSVSRLIRAFSARHIVPVQTDKVLDVLKTWGVRDEIWFFPDAEMDTGIMKGQAVEWDAPWDDGTTKRFADIYTAKDLSSGERRLIQCKELLHLLDPEWARVCDHIMDLIQEVVASPDNPESYDEDMDEGNDHRTIWSALAILFPWQVREIYLPGYRLNLITPEFIATQVDLSVQQVKLAMSENWPAIYAKMVDGAIYRPVINKGGEIELYDIYIDGKWIGSQRTLDQCEDRLRYLLKSA